jgi:hypothetical protein
VKPIITTHPAHVDRESKKSIMRVLPFITAAVSEIKPGGKKVSIGGPRRAVLVLSSPPEVFDAESDRFIGGPDKIYGSVLGVIESIPTDKPWIVGVYIAVDLV